MHCQMYMSSEFTEIIMCATGGEFLGGDVMGLSIALDFSVCDRMQSLIQMYQIGNMLLQDLYWLQKSRYRMVGVLSPCPDQATHINSGSGEYVVKIMF